MRCSPVGVLGGVKGKNEAEAAITCKGCPAAIRQEEREIYSFRVLKANSRSLCDFCPSVVISPITQSLRAMAKSGNEEIAPFRHAG